MVLKPDQQRIKELLSETITLLCRNGLHFKSEFSIEALIGITLDQDDVFLVSIKQTVNTGEENSDRGVTWERPKSSDRHRRGVRRKGGEGGSLEKDKHASLINDCGLVVDKFFHEEDKEESVEKNPLSLAVRAMSTQPSPHLNLKRRRNDHALKKSYVDGDLVKKYEHLSFDAKHQRLLSTADAETSQNERSVSLKLNREEEEENDGERLIRPNSSDVKPDVNSCSVFDERESLTGDPTTQISIAESRFLSSFCNGSGGAHDNYDDIGDDVNEKMNDENDKEFMQRHDVTYIKSEPVSDDICPTPIDGRQSKLRYHSSVGRRLLSRGNTVGIMHPLNVHVQQADAVGCSSWGASNLQLESSSHNTPRQKWMSAMASCETQVQQPVDEDGSPCLSDEEMLIARTILSMRGNFISLGCLKANRQSLRKTSREQLVSIIDKISSPSNADYFIGQLYDFGVSRIFFKCPPSSVTSKALNYYGIDLGFYVELFNAPVTVDKNIRDPVCWVQRVQERSPFK